MYKCSCSARSERTESSSVSSATLVKQLFKLWAKDVLFSLYIKTLCINYKNINILEIAQQVNPEHILSTILSVPISYMFCTDCVGYRIMFQTIKLLSHVSSSLKVFPSGISPRPHLYFYRVLKVKHVFVQKPLSLSNFSSAKTPFL